RITASSDAFEVGVNPCSAHRCRKAWSTLVTTSGGWTMGVLESAATRARGGMRLVASATPPPRIRLTNRRSRLPMRVAPDLEGRMGEHTQCHPSTFQNLRRVY